MSTTRETRDELKDFFQVGALPTQEHYASLIDTGLSRTEDHICKMTGHPVSIQAESTGNSRLPVLQFFTRFSDPQPKWGIELNPSAGYTGFNLHDGSGNSRLFINENTGAIGFGTTDPGAKLEVNGALKITGGIPGIGKVLLTDATGMASWETIPGARWEANANASASYLSGRVGIGTSSPDAMLHVAGDLLVAGNVTVEGDQFISNSQTVEIQDNLLLLNKGENGAGITATEAGLEFDRGAATNYKLIFDEESGNLKAGEAGNEKSLAQHPDNPADRGIVFRDSTNKVFTTNADVVFKDAKIGVGTADPLTQIEVAGSLRTTGVIETTDLLKIAGANPGTGKVLTSDATGLAVWQEVPGARWEKNTGSDTFYNSGNIGLGLNNPEVKLHLDGTLKSTGTIETDSQLKISGGHPGEGKALLSDADGLARWDVIPGSLWELNADGDAYSLSGNIGVGTNTPAELLDVNGTLSVKGNLRVEGGQLIIGTDNLELEDPVLLLNKGEQGAGITLGEAGLEFDRGTANNYTLVFDENNQQLKAGEAGNLKVLALRENTSAGNGIAFWQAATTVFASENTFVFNSGSLGIGIENPTATLELSGSMTVSGDLELGGQAKITSGHPGEGKVLTSDAEGFTSWQQGDVWTRNTADISYSSGVIGLGTTEPTVALDIVGSLKATNGVETSGQLSITGGNPEYASVLTSDTDGLTSWQAMPGARWEKNTDATIYYSSGSVGIGTAVPAAMLDVNGDLLVSGNLSVRGTQLITNTHTTEVQDNVITLNTGEQAAGITAGEAGLEFDRGTATNYKLIFDEGSTDLKAGEDGHEKAIALHEETLIDRALVFWNEAAKRLDTDASFVWSNHHVGIGTNDPLAPLQIGTTIRHKHTYDFSTAPTPLLVHTRDNSGGNTLAPTQSVFAMAREGVSGEASGNMVDFRLGRYENNHTYSRTQLDILLADDQFELREVMSLRANGAVGIGVTNPVAKLEVAGQIKINANNPEAGKVLISDAAGLATWGTISESPWDRNGNAVHYTPGHVGIGTTNPLGALQIGSAILHKSNYSFSAAAIPLLLHARDHNGGNRPAAGQSVLALVREGISAQAYGNMVDFQLRRYENNATNSRTQLDIFLAESSFDLHHVMSLRAAGRIGIGLTNPITALDIAGQLKIAGGEPGIGKVLVSDSTGMASWQDISGAYWKSNPDSTIYYDSGHVGVGVTEPLTSLDVNEASNHALTVRSGNHYSSYAKNQILFGSDGTTNYRHAIKTRISGSSSYPHSIDFCLWRSADTATAVGTYYSLSLVDGNVGIGTTAPGSKLEVAGQVKITEGSPGAGKVLTSDGNGLGSWEAIPGTRWEKNTDNTIYHASGNVGVGVTEPLTSLDVNEASNHALTVRSGNHYSSYAKNQILFGHNGTTNYRHAIKTRISGSSTNPHSIDFCLWKTTDGINSVGTYYSLSLVDGNVGIGTTAPGSKLEVAGQVKITEGSPGAGKVLTSDGSGLGSWEAIPGTRWEKNTDNTIYHASGSVGVGVTEPLTPLDVNESSNHALTLRSGNHYSSYAKNQILFGHNGTTNYRHAIKTRISGSSTNPHSIDFCLWRNTDAVTAVGTYYSLSLVDGNVGVGTTAPGSKLEVAGQVKITEGSPGAGKVLTSDGSGLGSWEAIPGTRWEKNTDNTIYHASGNVGVGVTEPLTSLDVNEASNHALTVRSGNHYSSYAKNQILFGSDGTTNYRHAIKTRISGSSSYPHSIDFCLWRSADTATAVGTYYSLSLVDGNVGIGTTAPGSKLEVAGQVKITEGSPGAGKVLTSDGNGLGSWEAIPGTRWEKNTDNTIYHASGNVGVGVTEPLTSLDVNEASNHALTVRSGNHYSSYAKNQILFGHNGTTNYRHAIKTRISGSSTNPHSIDFYLWKSTDTATAVGTQQNLSLVDGNVGIGTTDPGADKLDVRGNCYSSEGWQSTNADYAEYFETEDGKPIPMATAVALGKNGKIHPAKKGEIPIGIVSENPSVVGNSPKEWSGKYLRNELGHIIMEEYEEEVLVSKTKKVKKERQKVVKKTIEEEVRTTEIVKKGTKYIEIEKTELISREVEEPQFKEVKVYDTDAKEALGMRKIPLMESYEEEEPLLDQEGQAILVKSGKKVKKKRPLLNPDYDESKEYTVREERDEWCCVGLLGQLPLRKNQPVDPEWLKIHDISDKASMWLVK